jgi:hypothetical protein
MIRRVFFEAGRKKYLFSGIIAIVLVFFAACAAGTRLQTQPAGKPSLDGSYRLLQYGCRYPDDIQNAAFLDREQDAYTFEVHAPEFEYKILEAQPGPQTLIAAEGFLKCSFHYQQSRLRGILAPDGTVIGYELRPLYSPTRFGMYDVLQIEYRMTGTLVRVYIRLDPRVEAIINNQGGDNRRGSGR